MIAVTGATGQLGRNALIALQKRTPADKIVAIVRDHHKAADLADLGFKIRVGNYDDANSMKQALHGIEKFLLISSNALGQRIQQHQTVIDVAQEVGVSLMAYTSLLHTDTATMDLAAEHRATEDAVRASKIPYVILRNGWYLENYSDNLTHALISGTLMGCAQDGRIAAASRADYAAAAAAVLTEPGHMNKIYELAGDRAFKMEELAAAVSKYSGKTVRYNNLTEQAYQAALLDNHLPPAIAHMLADSDSSIAKGELDDDSHQLSKLIGRPTTSLDAILAQVLAKNPQR
jgi:NAD(P)H dehydrogenase (quinone)